MTEANYKDIGAGTGGQLLFSGTSASPGGASMGVGIRRNRGTLPMSIYDFINQIVGEVTTLQHHQGNAAQWADEGRD